MKILDVLDYSFYYYLLPSVTLTRYIYTAQIYVKFELTFIVELQIRIEKCLELSVLDVGVCSYCCLEIKDCSANKRSYSATAATN